MITIFSFIPKNYIKYDKNDKPSISLFSSIKTSILNQEALENTNRIPVNFPDKHITIDATADDKIVQRLT